MESFSPISFSCDMCQHMDNKYLPPGTKFTTCNRCGNLIDLSKIERRRQRITARTNSMHVNKNRSNYRTMNSMIPPMTMYPEEEDEYMNYPFQNNNFDYDLDNFDDDFDMRSNRNANRRSQQQPQGMFQINIPNENYNRRNHHRLQLRHNIIEDDDVLFNELDFEFELENDINAMMRNIEDFNMNVDLPNLGRSGSVIINSSKPKPKLKKEEMTRKMYTKNDKGKPEPPVCCICLVAMKVKDSVCHLPCKHIFHYKCIEKWAETKQECPYCRSDMNKKPETAKKKKVKK